MDELLAAATRHGSLSRLEGDDLYTWARLISDIEHAQENLDRFGKQVMARSGFDPRTTTLTNDGYFIESPGVLDQSVRRRDLAIPGSAIQSLDPHRDAGVGFDQDGQSESALSASPEPRRSVRDPGS